jgi:hypothetical protein
MIDKGLLVLQEFMDLLELDTVSCDKSQVMDIKVEEVMDVKEEEDLILITFPQIKTEHEVSCMSA